MPLDETLVDEIEAQAPDAMATSPAGIAITQRNVWKQNMVRHFKRDMKCTWFRVIMNGDETVTLKAWKRNPRDEQQAKIEKQKAAAARKKPAAG